MWNRGKSGEKWAGSGWRVTENVSGMLWFQEVYTLPNPADTCWQFANATLCWKKLTSDNPGLAPGQLCLLDKSLTSSGSKFPVLQTGRTNVWLTPCSQTDCVSHRKYELEDRLTGEEFSIHIRPFLSEAAHQPISFAQTFILGGSGGGRDIKICHTSLFYFIEAVLLITKPHLFTLWDNLSIIYS